MSLPNFNPFTFALDLPPVISTSVFDNPTNTTDITLEVKGRQLHVNKGVLATASAVFERMLQGDFKEKNAANIPLPGKSYDEIVEMLLCIYPSELKAITREKVDVLLKLADEYEIDSLRRNCEHYLLSLCQAMENAYTLDKTELVHFMLLADKYDLASLLEKTTDIASKVTFKGLSYPKRGRQPIADEKEYGELSEKTSNLYLSKRVHYLEKAHKVN